MAKCHVYPSIPCRGTKSWCEGVFHNAPGMVTCALEVFGNILKNGVVVVGKCCHPAYSVCNDLQILWYGVKMCSNELMAQANAKKGFFVLIEVNNLV